MMPHRFRFFLLRARPSDLRGGQLCEIEVNTQAGCKEMLRFEAFLTEGGSLMLKNAFKNSVCPAVKLLVERWDHKVRFGEG